MKYLFGLLVAVLLLTGLLTACAENRVVQGHAVIYTSSASQLVSPDISVLEEFVNAMNDQQAQASLDLFDDLIVLTSNAQYNLGTNIALHGWINTYTGKAEVQGWLEYQTGAVIRIVPVASSVAAQVVTLQAVFYYSNFVQEIRLDAVTVGGRIKTLHLFIEKSKNA